MTTRIAPPATGIEYDYNTASLTIAEVITAIEIEIQRMKGLGSLHRDSADRFRELLDIRDNQHYLVVDLPPVMKPMPLGEIHGGLRNTLQALLNEDMTDASPTDKVVHERASRKLRVNIYRAEYIMRSMQALNLNQPEEQQQ